MKDLQGLAGRGRLVHGRELDLTFGGNARPEMNTIITQTDYT
jgi:hypothetical protein